MTEEQVLATEAMVNMDTLGLAPTEIWSSHSDKRLNGALGYVARQLNVPISGVNVEQIGSKDSEQFAARKIPSITISSKDRLSVIRLDYYYQTYRLLAAYVAFLDEVAGATAAADPR
jgi:hypothetical protein